MLRDKPSKADDMDEMEELDKGAIEMERKLRHIYLFQTIDSESSVQVIAALHALATESEEPIYLFINSNGGNLVDGFAIYDAIKDMPCPVVTIGTGNVASAAFLIYLAGHLRLAYEHVTFMAHMARGGFGGRRTKSAKLYVNDIIRQESMMFDCIAKETGKTKKFWLDLIDQEDYSFGKKEAKKLGVTKEK